MATKTVGMKLAITSEEEILSLLRILNELESLWKYDLQQSYLKDIDLSEYEILKGFDKSDPEEFLSDLLKYLYEIHHSRILWNCDTMLKNCADLELDHLDFNPDIKRGLELVELEKENRLKIL